MSMREEMMAGVKKARTPVSKKKKTKKVAKDKTNKRKYEDANQIDSSGYTTKEAEKVNDANREARAKKMNKLSDDEFMKEME